MKPGLTARGKKMPMTTAEFHHMGDLYEVALLDRDAEISKLKNTVNTLRAKLKTRRFHEITT